MKKFAVIALAALLVAAFTVPASALQADFGGYWRTRAYTEKNFTGDDSEASNLTQVDTRTRLYFTAKINDNLKFINKFEMDAVWGGADRTEQKRNVVASDANNNATGQTPVSAVTRVAASSYGDPGADGVAVEVKNSYADFNLGPVFFLVGVHNFRQGRSFLFDDDFAGIALNIKPTSQWALPLYYYKAFEGGPGVDEGDFDVDIFGTAPEFKVSDMFFVKPYFFAITSTDFSAALNSANSGDFRNVPAGTENLDLYYIGLDLDLKLKPASFWFTGIYETGNADTATVQRDVTAMLLAGGGMANFGAMDVHGQAFYATGDDNAADNDLEAFFTPFRYGKGRSYNWAEIMGEGIFDTQISNNSPGTQPSNIMAGNIGVGFKATDKLKITADVWLASLVEDNANGDTDLGTEIDLKLTYEVLKNLNLDVVGAWLLAGDATTNRSASEKDPYEIGTQLSLSF